MIFKINRISRIKKILFNIVNLINPVLNLIQDNSGLVQTFLFSCKPICQCTFLFDFLSERFLFTPCCAMLARGYPYSTPSELLFYVPFFIFNFHNLFIINLIILKQKACKLNFLWFTRFLGL